MTENEGPNNIDPEQVDIPIPPLPHVIGWNEKECTRECPHCKTEKIFLRGPVVRDAAKELKFVCSGCVEDEDHDLTPIPSGLVALLNLGRMAMANDKSTISALEDLRLHLKKYRDAVESSEQA